MKRLINIIFPGLYWIVCAFIIILIKDIYETELDGSIYWFIGGLMMFIYQKIEDERG